MNQLCCSACDEPLHVGALSCAKCGEPAPPEDVKRAGPVVALFGALFLGVGPFLAWLDYGVKTVSGVEETRKQALILVGLAVFGAMFAVSALTGKKFTGLRGNIIAGIVAIGLSVYFYIELRYLVGGQPGDPRFGTGMYFCLAGAALLFVGGLLTRSPKGDG
jgi:hypothetical protein